MGSLNCKSLAACSLFISFFFTSELHGLAAGKAYYSHEKEMVNIGVIMDNNSKVGKISSRYLNIALSEFYEEHSSYHTRLSLHWRYPRSDIVEAASEALDLMENERVHAIIGPTWSSQTKFVIELGAKADVPIISFSATSPSLSTARNTFFVRTAYDDSFQVKAIAAVVQAFGWREVVPVYEDTDFGNGLIPYITDAFQEIDTRVPYRSVINPLASDSDIVNELVKLMMMQTRVFLVHMTASLGTRLFLQANKLGMMNDVTVWIVTDGLTTLLDPIDREAVKSMQGVIGVRPYLPRSKQLQHFIKKHSIEPRKLNLFALWGYDTVWALADAVEEAWNASNSKYQRATIPYSGTGRANLSAIGISLMGPEIKQVMRNSKFDGLTGHFELINGQLQPSVFEIFNVVGKNESVIGYWTLQDGISTNVPVNNSDKPRKEYSTSINDLKPPTWPGGTHKQPEGWVVPSLKGKKFKIGVPVKDGFSEFFKIEWDSRTGVPTYSGFSYDIFMEVLNKLPFALPCEFKPFMNASRHSAGSYDDMLYQIKLGEVDAVVGDTTIRANRSNFVEFSLPYMESGIAMLVEIKDDERRNMWIFLKPLKWNLWLTMGMAFVFTGFVVWVLERHNKDFDGSRSEQLGVSIWFSFSTLVFAHRERVMNSWTKVVLVIWVFVVLIITQSYTASLASFLTVQRLQPKFADVGDLVRKQYYVGYQKDSFVKDLLIQEMGFDESRLRPYGSTEEYRDALVKGTDKGGVAAIFEEIPCLKVFLAKYCDQFTMVGPIYKSDGFGFAFPLRSPLVSYVSRAVLNVIQDRVTMDAITRKNFLGKTSSCQDALSMDLGTRISSTDSDLSLSVYSFGGLFIITGAASLLALLVELLVSNRSRRFSSGIRDSVHTVPSPLVWSKFFMDVLANKPGVVGRPAVGIREMMSMSRVVPLDCREQTMQRSTILEIAAPPSANYL